MLAEVQHLDLDDRVVHALAPDDRRLTLPYDTLVVATGCTDAYFGHEEWSVFAPGLKTLADAHHLRSHILGAFEMAELATDPAEQAAYLTFAVIGAGPTGVEMPSLASSLANAAMPASAWKANASFSAMPSVSRLTRRIAPYTEPFSGPAT